MSVALPVLRRVHRLNVRAPEMTMILLVAISLLGVVASKESMRGTADESVSRAEKLLATVPYRLGSWVGIDVPLTSRATEILHTTAILSRRYTNLGTGDSASLSIVYCGDARDMLGHHPPSCYPASGWIPSASGHERVSVDVGGPCVANLYRFMTVDSAGEERRISIVGFYILPESGPTEDAERLRSNAGRRAISARGVGQVQVLIDGWPEKAAIEQVASALLRELPRESLDVLEAEPAGGSTGAADGDGGERDEGTDTGGKS